MENTGVEPAFVPGIEKIDVRRYFEREKRGRIFGSREEVAEIERRYAPVGIFDATRTEEIKEGIISPITKNIREDNNFYVNLNSGDLYHIGKGILERKPKVKALDIIKRIADLPMESIAILSDIFRHGEISYENLNKKHFLFLDGIFDNILILQTRGLIEIRHRIFHAASSYINNVDIPSFDNIGYNLKKFLYVGFMENGHEKDPLIYSPLSLAEVLGVFFRGDVKFNGMIYMPYDRCRYVDRKERFRYDVLISPKLL